MADAFTRGTRFRAKDDVLFQDLNGEAVLLNLESGVYFGLNQVGTRVWQLLASPMAVKDLVRVIVAEFDVEEAQCRTDLSGLVADLHRHGLVATER